MTDQDDLVTVATFHTPMEAELAKERLESIGIGAFLKNEMAVGVMPYLGGGLGGIELQVTQSNADQARELLEPPVDTPRGSPDADA